MRFSKIIIIITLIFGLCNSIFAESFNDFIVNLKQKAIKKGYSEVVVNQAFSHVQLLHTVSQRNRHQYQQHISFDKYRGALLNGTRLQIAQRQLHQHAKLLAQIEKKYQVPAVIIVALWGLESDFGHITGNYPEFSALATLAYHSERKDFFMQEIFAALTMLKEHQVPWSWMKGSWAGAMGQCQFMPSAYLKFAVAYQHAGPANIWTHLPDVFASIAHFLQQKGWQPNSNPTLIPVQLNHAVPWSKIGLKFKQTLTKWKSDGILPKIHQIKSRQNHLYSLIIPDGIHRPAYLVNWRNFQALMHWNPSEYYALSVSLFAQSLRNK